MYFFQPTINIKGDGVSRSRVNKTFICGLVGFILL